MQTYQTQQSEPFGSLLETAADTETRTYGLASVRNYYTLADTAHSVLVVRICDHATHVHMKDGTTALLPHDP